MRHAMCVIGCLEVLALLAVSSQAEEPLRPEQPDSKRISQLIRELDADTFSAREEASAALSKLGESAEASLVEELKSARSREVEQRATALLKAIRLERIARNAVRLEDLLEAARLSNQAKLDTDALEAKLQRLVDVLAQATDTKPALPVRFSEVAIQPPSDTSATKALVLGESVSITFARQSVIIADTAVQVTHATNCIIIARYVVELSHSDNCLIIAGRVLGTSIDSKSMLLSGATCNVNIANDSIVAAPDVQVGIPKSVQFVNCGAGAAAANHPARPNDKSSLVETPGIVLNLPQRADPLADKVTITFSMHGPRKPDSGFVLLKRAGQGGEYVVRVGNEPKSPDGLELPDLKGWTLRYAGRQFAVFGNGQQESCLSVSPR